MEKLSLVKGVVQNLQISRSYEDFVFTQVDKNLAGVASIGAVSVGQLFNSTSLATASGGAEISVDCFTCTVNNLLLGGRFHEVQFKDGDEVEFVIEQTPHGAVVYAARSPSKFLLWMLPHQMRGVAAQKRSDIKWTLIFSLVVPSLFTFFAWLKLPTNGTEPLWLFPLMFFLIFLGIFAVSFWVFFRLSRHSKQATEVIRALGYKNPENVDLPALSKIAEKRIQIQTGKLPSVLSPWSFWY